MHSSHTVARGSTLMLIAAAMLVLQATGLNAQSTERQTSGPLYDELARMDSLLFDVAFVSCDAEAFRTFFTDDAEFYHDRVGPTYGEAVTTLGDCPREQGVRRVLVQGSLEVYPMNGYGAIQMGEHRFVEEGAETNTIAKFVHLWREEEGRWRIARVLSFEHRPDTR